MQFPALFAALFLALSAQAFAATEFTCRDADNDADDQPIKLTLHKDERIKLDEGAGVVVWLGPVRGSNGHGTNYKSSDGMFTLFLPKECEAADAKECLVKYSNLGGEDAMKLKCAIQR